MAERKPNNNTKIKLPGVVIVMLNADNDKKTERPPALVEAAS